MPQQDPFCLRKTVLAWRETILTETIMAHDLWWTKGGQRKKAK